MNPLVQKVLVIGGNGFIGSAVCRAALARGMQVTSISSSGQPYRTAKGHSPAWTAKVDWQKGDALEPQSFAHLFQEATGVVHTLGTLIEDGNYKNAMKAGDIPGLMSSFITAVQSPGNPLKKEVGGEKKGSYEVMNRDTALRVCEAFVASKSSEEFLNKPRPFIYISAEDIFRPVIPARYIETKREAERSIDQILHNKPAYRGVYIRPSLVYHAHHRPLTTPPAVLFDLSATIHAKAPTNFPTPSSILRLFGSSISLVDSKSPGTLGTSLFDSLANALVIPPIHVDHVGEAICVALSAGSDVQGVVDVGRMRELIGWSEKARKARVGLEV